MVVGLDLERHRESIANRYDARVLARTLKHPGCFGWQRPQQGTRMFVRAVLAPQRTDDSELGKRRSPAEHVDKDLVLLGRESVLGDQGRRDLRITEPRRDDGRLQR